jgi:muconate cycloisomerase
LELALLDLAGHRFGTQAAALCGDIVHSTVTYSGVVSGDNEEATRIALEQISEMGFVQAKLKVGGSLEEDEFMLRTAQSVLGKSCRLRVDANCAWESREALERIKKMIPYGIGSVEQPLRADDFDGLTWLTSRSPIPIMVDESLASFEDAERLIAQQACHQFNLRVSKCGGLINTARIRDLAATHGISCQLGSQVGETAILSAAGRQFATRSSGLSAIEGSFGTYLLLSDVSTEPVCFGHRGHASAIAGLGLGITIDSQALSSMLISTHRLEST